MPQRISSSIAEMGALRNLAGTLAVLTLNGDLARPRHGDELVLYVDVAQHEWLVRLCQRGHLECSTRLITDCFWYTANN